MTSLKDIVKRWMLRREAKRLLEDLQRADHPDRVPAKVQDIEAHRKRKPCGKQVIGGID